MRVGVDQARHQDGFGTVETVGGLKLSTNVRALSDSDDAFAADRHRAVVDQTMLGVHGDHIAGAVDPVGRFVEGKWTRAQ
jgi:hypothetical protein